MRAIPKQNEIPCTKSQDIKAWQFMSAKVDRAARPPFENTDYNLIIHIGEENKTWFRYSRPGGKAAGGWACFQTMDVSEGLDWSRGSGEPGGDSCVVLCVSPGVSARKRVNKSLMKIGHRVGGRWTRLAGQLSHHVVAPPRTHLAMALSDSADHGRRAYILQYIDSPPFLLGY